MSGTTIRILSLVLALGVVGFVVMGFCVIGKVDFGDCIEATSRRARTVQYYLCSPRLLAGGWREIFAFAWLWSFPTIAALTAAFPWLKSRFTLLSSFPHRN